MNSSSQNSVTSSDTPQAPSVIAGTFTITGLQRIVAREDRFVVSIRLKCGYAFDAFTTAETLLDFRKFRRSTLSSFGILLNGARFETRPEEWVTALENAAKAGDTGR